MEKQKNCLGYLVNRHNNQNIMKNCSKCGSENIKKIAPFARRIQDGEQPQKLENQVVTYSCIDCGNTKSVKFSEDLE